MEVIERVARPLDRVGRPRRSGQRGDHRPRDRQALRSALRSALRGLVVAVAVAGGCARDAAPLDTAPWDAALALPDLAPTGPDLSVRRQLCLTRGIPDSSVRALNPLAQVATGDFDGDGRNDLAVSTTKLGGDLWGLFALFGRDDGLFNAAMEVEPGLVVEHLAASDLDGDGRSELVAVNRDGLVVLRAIGHRAFERMLGIGWLDPPGGAAIADFDGDGQRDLATLQSGKISILDALGSGRPPTGRWVATGGATQLVAADLDGDGHPDLAALDGTSVVAWLNGGDGRLGPGQVLSLGHALSVLAAADFNNDGRDDLIAAYAPSAVAPPGLALVSSRRPGDPLTSVDVSTGAPAPGSFRVATPVAIAVGDFNHDGHVDVVVAADYVWAFAGNGDRTFQSDGITFPEETNVLTTLAAAQFHGDGILDLAIGGYHYLGAIDQDRAALSVVRSGCPR